jgi:hypothetical protein
MQKFMKGSGSTPDEFEQRGWCSEKSKIFTQVDPLDFARDWQCKHKRKLTSDLDQALISRFCSPQESESPTDHREGVGKSLRP